MNELVKSDLLKKLCLLQKDEDFKEKLEKNNCLNEELMEVINQIIIFYAQNKSKNRDSLVYLRNMLNYFIKTARVRYDEVAKVKRLNNVIENIGG